jgi:hypothetical protein
MIYPDQRRSIDLVGILRARNGPAWPTAYRTARVMGLGDMDIGRIPLARQSGIRDFTGEDDFRTIRVKHSA